MGIIGGTGFYSFFDDATGVEVDTAFGPPSGPLTVGEVAGRRVAFLPRHGERHQYAPHTVNYRANLRALKAVGVDTAAALATVNVLGDEGIRQGIKGYSRWPTIPQLYVKGEFIGGSDIMMEMYESGELQQLLGGQAT